MVELAELEQEKQALMQQLESLGQQLTIQNAKCKAIEQEATVQERKLRHAESMQKTVLDAPQLTPLGLALPKFRAPKVHRSKTAAFEPAAFQASSDAMEDETKETDPDHAEFVNKFTSELSGRADVPILHASILEVPEVPEDEKVQQPDNNGNESDSDKSAEFDRQNHSIVSGL